jgi:hypothetical protein
MLERVSGVSRGTSFLPAVSGTCSSAANGSDDADERWFAFAAKSLLDKDAGFALHIITGFPERTCYYYASGERKTTGHFVRSLLRSDQGWQWLNVIMDGATAAWWLEAKSAKTRLAECEATLQSLLQSIQQQLNH